MKLPNKTRVEREKIVDYLLNPAHPDNGGKASFFTQLGFKREQWEILAKALTSLADESDVTTVTKSPHGQKYVIVGQIQSTGGESASVKTIWIVDKNQDKARLVTAYPHKAGQHD